MKLKKIKRGSKNSPRITVSTETVSGIIFEGTPQEHQTWFDSNCFIKGTVHHVYTDYGGNNVQYFKATKK